MIVTAIVKCKWCGAVITIPEKQTTRLFMTALKELRRKHDWDCKANYYSKKIQVDKEND